MVPFNKSNNYSTESNKSRVQTLSLGSVILVLSLNSILTVSDAFQASSAFTTGRRQWLLPPSSKSMQYLQQSTTRRSRSSSSTLSMHFGHSHSHHEHEHHHDHHDDFDVSKVVKTCTNRKTLSRFAFAALVTLVPPLFLRRAQQYGQLALLSKITKVDMGAFLATSTALFLFDKTKKQAKIISTRVKLLHDKISQTNAIAVNNDSKAADRVTYIGAIINLLLSVGKAFIGINCHSAALVADAGHSLSDLFSDFITLGAVRIGRLPADEDHPYGHGKFEALGSLFLSLTLLGTGFSVGAVSNKNLMNMLSASSIVPVEIPTSPALVMAALSIISKEWLFKITRKVGERIRSPVVIANAWHHRSDAYSSILALVSVGLAMTFPSLVFADSAAGLLVACMICTTGFEIGMESIKQLTDTNNKDLVHRIEELIQSEEIAGTGDVSEIVRVRARQVGSSALVDVAVITSGREDISSSALHAIEDRIRWRIMEEDSRINHNGHHDSEGEAGGGMAIDVEVHATSSGEGDSCPLINDDGVVSAAIVEEGARTALQSHPSVKSVEGITVHYHDILLVDVDAHIRLDVPPSSTSVRNACLLAEELRNGLENQPNIHKARIYLDLNQDSAELGEDPIIKSLEETFAMSKNNTITSSLPWLFDTTGDIVRDESVVKSIEDAVYNQRSINMTNVFPYFE